MLSLVQKISVTAVMSFGSHNKDSIWAKDKKLLLQITTNILYVITPETNWFNNNQYSQFVDNNSIQGSSNKMLSSRSSGVSVESIPLVPLFQEEDKDLKFNFCNTMAPPIPATKSVLCQMLGNSVIEDYDLIIVSLFSVIAF